MSHRNQAIAVLKEAREILINRLTQRVLNAKEEILDDAMGESYLSDIETIYEQLGGRLYQLNQMITSLPPDQDALYAAEHNLELDPESNSNVDVISIDTNHAWEAEVEPTETAPIPESVASEETAVQQPQTLNSNKKLEFRRFLELVDAGSISEAGKCLSPMFGLDEPLAEQCAFFFANKYREDKSIVTQAMNIRFQLMAEKYNDAILALSECFDLQGLQSITVLQSLKMRL